jgi:hypothetical protein
MAQEPIYFATEADFRGWFLEEGQRQAFAGVQ